MRIALVFSSLFIVNCLASSVLKPPDPNNPGKCIYDGIEFDKGKNQIPGSCVAVHCFEDGSWILINCEPKRFERCKRGDFVDLSLPYPECCKWYFECENERGAYLVIR